MASCGKKFVVIADYRKKSEALGVSVCAVSGSDDEVTRVAATCIHDTFIARFIYLIVPPSCSGRRACPLR